jgi:hypothetical protein
MTGESIATAAIDATNFRLFIEDSGKTSSPEAMQRYR